jgi:hypothetical protein
MTVRPRLLLAAVIALASGLAFISQVHADRATRQVAAWYQRYLDRYPDEDGLRAWADKLRGGRDPIEVEASIISSDEYWRRSDYDPARFVDRMFRDTTGRPPSERDFRSWVDRVRDGDRQQVAVDLLRSLHGDRPWH